MGGNPKQDDLLADEISVAPVDPSTEITVLDTSDIASVQTDWGDDGLWDDFTAEQVNPQSQTTGLPQVGKEQILASVISSTVAMNKDNLKEVQSPVVLMKVS